MSGRGGVGGVGGWGEQQPIPAAEHRQRRGDGEGPSVSGRGGVGGVGVSAQGGCEWAGWVW